MLIFELKFMNFMNFIIESPTLVHQIIAVWPLVNNYLCVRYLRRTYLNMRMHVCAMRIFYIFENSKVYNPSDGFKKKSNSTTWVGKKYLYIFFLSENYHQAEIIPPLTLKGNRSRNNNYLLAHLIRGGMEGV